ncbi:MAG: tRNA1(Val) (adenine(37)-N6)-methyltransferase [Lachnospiraceae bacterium]|nr:tRNA1(Val) (adenine(37)-N6)-methyltransferase [Lachnospiraceae bacterium]
MNVGLKEGERIDDLQIKGYQIIQQEDGFCFGMDAVLLSSYVKHARPTSRSHVCDLCTGTGILPILMEAKYDLNQVEGLEIQESCVDMARRSVLWNALEDHITITEGDVKEIRTHYHQDSYDIVTCNPPYMTGSHGLTNDQYGKAVSRHEILCTLDDVVKGAAWMLKMKGHLVMVHRPFRLAEIIVELRNYHLEPKRMRLVYPYLDREPNMVLIDAVKGGKQRITVDPPLIVYNKDGSYTDEIYQIYGMDPNH